MLKAKSDEQIWFRWMKFPLHVRDSLHITKTHIHTVIFWLHVNKWRCSHYTNFCLFIGLNGWLTHLLLEILFVLWHINVHGTCWTFTFKNSFWPIPSILESDRWEYSSNVSNISMIFCSLLENVSNLPNMYISENSNFFSFSIFSSFSWKQWCVTNLATKKRI